MVVPYAIILLFLIYGSAFKDDFPYILVQRTIYVVGILLIIINIPIIFRYIMFGIQSLF